jgi:diadenosine tetraphosphate (Ap4A) HIT family hydrolase
VSGCVACDSVRGRRPVPGGPVHAGLLWQVDHRPGPALVLGYLFVKTIRHVESLAELSRDEAEALGPVLRATCRAVEDVLGAERVHVASWGEGVRHVHFHVLPRTPGLPRGNRAVQLWLLGRELLWRLGRRRLEHPSGAVETTVARLRAAMTQAIGGET